MKKQVPAYLLKKYLDGHCTPREEAEVELWYNSFEKDADHLSTISAIRKSRLKSRIRSRIQENIKTQEAENRFTVRGEHVRGLILALSAIAASFLVFFMIYQKKPVVATEANNLVSVTNNSRNIHEQVLADGSHVWMMPGSAITYRQTFIGNKREITLAGESFFEVTKNPAKPFIIYSRNLVTKVWGTSFRVRDSKELSFADVTVLTGKVSVRLLRSNSPQPVNPGKIMSEVMLYPNEKVTYYKAERVLKSMPKADMQGLYIWKKQSISFDNKPIKEVIPVLDKAFNVDISTADEKVNGYLLNADFNGLNFPEIMEILHKALDVNYEITGNTVVLKQAINQ